MSPLPARCLETLCEDVQHNCSISDARYARDYSLCVYLLRMREFYRWQHNLPLMQRLEVDGIGQWISETEARWDELEECDFRPLKIDGTDTDPFDSNLINKRLAPAGFIYSAGLGRLGQPHFVLAKLASSSTQGSTTSYECGQELARDSITMPAMTQNQTIFIRHDSIKRHIWQMLDEWLLQKKEGPFAHVVAHFELDNPSKVDQPIEGAARQLARLYHAHEMGEVRAASILGDQYHQMLQQHLGTRNEFYLRAVRDIIADSLETWPYLLSQRSNVELDFWLASLAGVRQQLLTATGMLEKLKCNAEADSRFDNLGSVFDAEQQRFIWIGEELLSQTAPDSSAVDLEQITLSLIEQSGSTES